MYISYEYNKQLEAESVSFKRILAMGMFAIPCLAVWYFVDLTAAASAYAFLAFCVYMSITPKH